MGRAAKVVLTYSAEVDTSVGIPANQAMSLMHNFVCTLPKP
ncbi:MAG TPA: hypothetical protein V6D14_16600 [Coleofasciculaceae cyanobacterium]|jgi:hypothetical protein